MFIADLHTHSKYSRATSKECVPEYLDLWARRKGLDLIGTGDFTHPAWRDELKEKLTPQEEGLYVLKDEHRLKETVGGDAKPRFIISGEISSIYKQDGKVRKVHNVILLPSIEASEALAHRLELVGNLHSDGRPILGLSSHDLLEITLEICPDAIFIPAHIWTPHFSLFGAYSGFDRIEDCFSDLTPHIHALETGLSSDPPMNWRLSALDSYTMVSNSDAHSPANLAREANLFNTELSYPAIAAALQNHDTDEFYGTLEFFPEEGKYHNDGHRNCKICLTPEETIAAGGKCPVCGRRITVGVLHRVVELADREPGYIPERHKHFESIVPLPEVVASSMGMTTASKKVKAAYEDIIKELGPELFILRDAPLEEISRKAGPGIAEGIRRLRCHEVEIHPGYDGEYGKILVMNKDDVSRFAGQISLFEKEEKAKHKDASFAGLPKPVTPSSPVQSVPPHPACDAKTLYGLNDGQWQGVSATDTVTAVLAGPGTGKTRTLVYRVAYLVEERGVDPSAITAVTFTNKAAGEMRERLQEHFNDKRLVKAMNIGTFHSICLKQLSEWNKNVTIIDPHEALSILADVLRACNCTVAVRDAMQEISRIKNGQVSLESAVIPQVVFEAYQAQLEKYHTVDYDDILLQALEKFESGDQKCEALLPRFSQLLVDEFQDINAVQYRLIRQWGKKSDAIFVIGDPDQAIYGFRGSDAHCFDRLRRDFSSVREIRLTQNYRSTPQILRAALPVLGHDEAFLQANRADSAKVRLLTAESPFSEALFIAKEINRMVGGVDMLDAHSSSKKRGERVRGFSEIAVLYRTHRQSEIIEDCLKKEGIPYVVTGRDDSLSDRRVRSALSFFRFLCDPRDSVSLTTCLKAASVPPVAAQELLLQYTAGKQNITSAIDLIRGLGNMEGLAGLLEKYAPLVRNTKPDELIGQWMEDNGLGEHLNCMERLQNTALFYDRMPAFLQNLSLGSEGDITRSGAKVYSPDAVTLMTLHASKGLEYPVVFLCGVTDGTIPLQNEKHTCDLSEERRLFYVGMTRAQDELLLLTDPQERSPFLSGIPNIALEEGKANPKNPPVGKQLGFF